MEILFQKIVLRHQPNLGKLLQINASDRFPYSIGFGKRQVISNVSSTRDNRKTCRGRP